MDPPRQFLHAFRHDAVLYSGQGEFLNRISAFVRDGLETGDAVLVMVTADKVGLLRDALGPDAAAVGFRDMAEIGRNPARIIPAWRDFFGSAVAAGRGVRGVGEPIWATRSREELVESQRHEELINLAFIGTRGWLICPYDTSTLDPWILQEAERSHPIIGEGTAWRDSIGYRGLEAISRPFDDPLPDPLFPTARLDFRNGPLMELRRFVSEEAFASGLDEEGTAALVMAVSEAAANTLRHAGGSGTLRVWREHDAVICEICDVGTITEPLVGRTRPALPDENGLGLWLVNQLCDLVQIRMLPTGTVIRMHKSLRT